MPGAFCDSSLKNSSSRSTTSRVAWTRKLKSGRYQGLYRDEAGRVRRAGTGGSFARCSDALEAARSEEANLRRGTWVDPESRRITVEELAERWLEGARPMLKPKTVASYESLLRSRVLPTFGRRQLPEVRPSDVTAWVGGMVADGISPSRIRQAHVVLRLIFDAAVRDGYLIRNPASGVKLPRLEHREAPFFEPQVVDAIADALGSPYDTLIAVLGVGGLRWGEAAALRRRHFDALRRRLLVEESLAEVSGRLIFGPTKSHTRRAVPLSPRLGDGLTQAVGKRGPNELIFTAPKGGPLRYQNFLARVWHPVLAEMGLPIVGVHVLRHSAAARMIAAGATPKTLQKVLGHRSAAFSLTIYGHLFDSDLDALADRLDTTTERKAQ